MGLGVGVSVDPHQFFDGQMGVFLSRGEILMPKQFLNAAKVSPVIQQVSGKGVTKKVRVYVQEQGAIFYVLLQVSLNGSSGDP
jgi:hypothetical protein